MKIAEAIGAAFGTFSRIPVPKSAWTDFGSTHALAAFPLVGLAEGFLMTAWGHVANLLGVHSPMTMTVCFVSSMPVRMFFPLMKICHIMIMVLKFRIQ